MDVPLKQISFPDPYQYKTVPAHSHATVWRHRVSGGYVAFVNRVGADWYAGSYYIWKMDGHTQDRIERTIQITEPQPWKPAVVAEREIIFEGYNDTDADLVMAIFCDGTLAKPR